MVGLVLSALALPVRAEAPSPPQPSLELPLGERGPCSIVACDETPPRPRAVIEHEIRVIERVLRNAIEPSPERRVRRYELQRELWRWHQLEVERLRARVTAACR